MRQKLKYWGLILVCGSIFWFGLVFPAQASSELSSTQTRHILERISFGITSQQMQQVRTQGIEAYIQSQLKPELIPESPKLTQSLAQFDLINQKPVKLKQKTANNQKKARNSPSAQQKQKLFRENLQLIGRVTKQAANSRLAKAVYSDRQLQEVMVDFWLNHFNVFARKKTISFWLNDYENDIRRNALGNFRALLGVTASHPAMLMYLDNQLNTAPNSPGARGEHNGLNENYARELMELHTLGVDGGYSQNDIITLAKIFTGWGVDFSGKKGDENNFFFYNGRHDQSEKVFLGRQITAKGKQEGEQALNILAAHPATAHFISYKLAQYFVADQPPETLVDTLAQKFLASQGDIRVVIDTLIHSREFNQAKYYKQKFKTPYQYIVSLARMSEVQDPNYLRIQGMLRQLSMPVYLCLPPTGYENTQSAWLNPQAMLQRVGMATAIANNYLNKNQSLKYSQVQANIGELSPHTKQAIGKNNPKLRTALILGSPEAMYR